ncbi:sugar ABC transporter integral membrane subunit [Halosimplex carlsbadense 2-9-1]|uniref:Sugar ABC transporter integral membrane subunit n=1 Tax=Halosimplex carlsbadense 2-9-1 TaxID=797114 RepID=M0CWF3_9EURY|nr:ABC transporter permease [Halosimplex carlsbadense]ELZ27546.1 sugar ABC transporter integral membrane subunit [Halosimplex carlsbadense 2-9-1]
MSVVDKVVGEDRDNDDLVLLFLDNLVWPILIATFVAFAFLLPESFFTSGNIRFLLLSSAALGMLALGESICLLSGHFDLSVGSIAGFSAMITGLFMTQWFPGAPGIVGIAVILLVGGTIGLMNGISVAYLGVNPFLQTLAFFIIFRGATIAASTYPITELPESYLFVGGGDLVPGVPFAVLILFAAFALIGFVLKYQPFGLSIYAVGGNEQASREAGINTKRVILSVYVLSGIFSGLAGLLFTGFLGAATPSLGENQMFPAFAAAIIGGISIFGGRGNILGALGGVLLLGTIEAGLVMLQVQPTLIRMTNGLILLGAILLYTGIEKYRKAKLQV